MAGQIKRLKKRTTVLHEHSRTPRILHVEDNPNDALLVQAALERACVAVQIRNAVDGQQAIEYLSGSGPYSDRKQWPIPDLILLDLNMPRVSGLDVLAWIRGQEQFRALPVLIVSSSAYSGDMQRARELGVVGQVAKTATFAALVAALGRFFAGGLSSSVRAVAGEGRSAPAL